jgi:hypothetical protein
MKVFEYIIAPLRKPSANALALCELEDARRELLASMSAQEYATAMVQYNQDRVARLSTTVQEMV